MKLLDRDQAAAEVKSRPELVFAERDRSGKGYICPLCGNGSGRDGDGVREDPNRPGHYTCFKAGCPSNGRSMDLIDWYAVSHSIPVGSAEAFQAIYEAAGIELIKGIERTPKQAAASMPEKKAEEPHHDYTACIEQCVACLSEDAREYLHGRGFTDDTIKRFRLGYDAAKEAIVIPYNSECTYYATRRTDRKEYRKPSSAEAGREPPFNAIALTEDGSRPVFIVESQLCAISIEQAGGRAVAIGGGGTDKLLLFLKAHREALKDKMLFLSLDNDDAGQAAQAALKEELTVNGFRATEKNPSGRHKDPNEFLQADPEGFTRTVREIESGYTKPDNVKTYLLTQFSEDVYRFAEGRKRKTGFRNLDEKLGAVYDALYIVGAVSSLGKTTFCHQWADQMAAAGNHILFFSCEQSKIELVSKSLSRISFRKYGKDHAKCALQIRGNMSSDTGELVQEYIETVNDRMNIIEGNFGITVKQIRDTVEGYIKANNVRPAVFVDYLQILAPMDARQETRAATDRNVSALKQMSRDLRIPVIVISSVNRQNYTTQMDFESFKETGAIEYTGDVVMGLQLAAISSNPMFEEDEKKQAKKKFIREKYEADPRAIELVGLKNRFGKKYFGQTFQYYPKFDTFTEVTSDETNDEKRSGVRRI